MTPYEIGIVFWYYTRAEDHPNVMNPPPVWEETIAAFIREQVLVYLDESERNPIFPQRYSLTERGRAYCESLQRVPLPRQTWVTDYPSGVL